jgi:hypothetical protein
MPATFAQRKRLAAAFWAQLLFVAEELVKDAAGRLAGTDGSDSANLFVICEPKAHEVSLAATLRTPLPDDRATAAEERAPPTADEKGAEEKASSKVEEKAPSAAEGNAWEEAGPPDGAGVEKPGEAPWRRRRRSPRRSRRRRRRSWRRKRRLWIRRQRL